MYLRYGVTGVVGEAERGFPSVMRISLPVYRRMRERGFSVNDAICEALLHLIAKTADTNILGRHDMETLRYAQRSAMLAIEAGGMRTESGKSAVSEMDADFSARMISPGGSADLIAITHFLYEAENLSGKMQESIGASK